MFIEFYLHFSNNIKFNNNITRDFRKFFGFFVAPSAGCCFWLKNCSNAMIIIQVITIKKVSPSSHVQWSILFRDYFTFVTNMAMMPMVNFAFRTVLAQMSDTPHISFRTEIRQCNISYELGIRRNNNNCNNKYSAWSSSQRGRKERRRETIRCSVLIKLPNALRLQWHRCLITHTAI